MGLYDDEEDKKINQEEQNSSEPFSARMTSRIMK